MKQGTLFRVKKAKHQSLCTGCLWRQLVPIAKLSSLFPGILTYADRRTGEQRREVVISEGCTRASGVH